MKKLILITMLILLTIPLICSDELSDTDWLHLEFGFGGYTGVKFSLELVGFTPTESTILAAGAVSCANLIKEYSDRSNGVSSQNDLELTFVGMFVGYLVVEGIKIIYYKISGR